MAMIERKTNDIFSSTTALVIIAVICTLFWGSAYPAVKAGYELVGIQDGSVFDKMNYAGIRFIFAGITIWLVTSLLNKRIVFPKLANLPRLSLLAFVQTTLQYFFYYIGLSNTTGATGAIISSSSTLLSVLFAAIAFKDDRITLVKIVGSVMGFTGILIGSTNDGLSELKLTLTGEGFLIIASILFALGTVITRRTTKDENAGIVASFSLLIGGLVLYLFSISFGGRIDLSTGSAVAILAYLVLLSTVALGLWTFLLSKHPVSRVMIFYSLIPIFGVLLSGLILHEKVFTWHYFLALVLVCGGIVIVNINHEMLSKRSLEKEKKWM